MRTAILVWLSTLMRAAGVGVLALLLMACASTSMTTMRDPAAGRTAYHRLLIVAPFVDLEARTQAEHIFVTQLASKGIQAIPSISVLLPTRTYTHEEVVALLAAQRLDGVLLVRLTEAATEQVYIPPITTTTGQATRHGNVLNFSAQTQQVGGYSIPQPRVHYELRLIDASTGQTVWLATSRTRGNAFARFETLVTSLASTALEKLHQDGMIR